MLVLRLEPVGKKHQRSFRLVVDERRHKLSGKNVEDLGWYNPHTDSFDFKKERIVYWIGAGAQPSDVVHNLLIRAGVIRGRKRPVHAKSKKKAEDTAESTAPVGGEKKEATPTPHESAPAETGVGVQEVVTETPADKPPEASGDNTA